VCRPMSGSSTERPIRTMTSLARSAEKGYMRTRGLTGPLKIAIVGMGVAGSYLINQLSREHDVIGFDRYPRTKFECVCAWGTSKDFIRRFAKDCDIDFDDHILHEGRTMLTSVGGMEIESRLCGLVSFDKHSFLEAMRRGHRIRYNTWIRSEEDLKNYDLIIDATGLRVLLPKIQSHELRIPCVQYRVEYERPPFEDFYIEVLEGMGGYLWYFPLGNRLAHVGAGDLNHGHMKAVEGFFDRYGGKKEKIVGRPVRLCPPRYCQPFQSGKVVGVGESIGTVFPLLGEGIIPTLECSELLVKNLHDLEEYRRRVLKKFAFYETAYNFLLPVFRGEIGIIEQATLSQAVLSHMWENQARYGVELQPTRLTIEPQAFIQQALSFARMIRI
jgi:flavin-dependent dehydrogenase